MTAWKEIAVSGAAPPETYPSQKKRHNLETLREFMHFRNAQQYVWSGFPGA